MKTESIHTIILGAGPSGLAAGYTLAKAGLKPVVVEKDKVPGGLMRSLKRGDFIVDIGRKELYNRLAKVDAFWTEILGKDYREYPHRGGLLYGGRIIDMSPAYQGIRRGMPWGMFIGCALDFFSARISVGASQPRNLEEYWYQQRGRKLTQITNQGFQEKLHGRKWADVALPESVLKNGGGPGFFETLKQGMVRVFTKKETNTFKGLWKHPARGTGQICEAMADGIVKAGGRILYEARLLGMAGASGTITSVSVETPSETIQFNPSHVISSTPAEFMKKLLLSESSAAAPEPAKAPARPQKVVVLVYLFLDGDPKFPHFWLQVTDQTTRIGRIANYAALNSDMMPKGRHCICCEIYCFGDDPLLKQTDQQFVEMTLGDCARQNLIDPGKCFDTMVLRFPGADASQNRHNWLNPQRQKLLAELGQFKNLYSVNRTDLDIATLAGIESAEAILSGDRRTFELHFDPRELGIRSESKPFEFRNPPGVQI
jgi:protoporphyrinogen oxidase